MRAQMPVLQRIFKKSLISGAEADAAALGEDGPTDLGGLDEEITAGPNSPPDRSAEPPRSSLKYAIAFVGRLLQWCAADGIHGRVDWPQLVVLADHLAMYDNRQRVTPMALAKALSKLGVKKSWRSIAPHEQGIVSFKRSRAQHPRVTVYILPKVGELPATANDPQLRLFD